MAQYNFPTDCFYTKEDEWVRVDDDRTSLGITDYAQQQLGDIVFIELPAAGEEVKQGEPFGVIESVKAVSDLYAPVTGRVVERNAALDESPELANESCYEDGWLLVIEPTDEAEFEDLMNAKEYADYVAERDED